MSNTESIAAQLAAAKTFNEAFMTHRRALAVVRVLAEQKVDARAEDKRIYLLNMAEGPVEVRFEAVVDRKGKPAIRAYLPPIDHWSAAVAAIRRIRWVSGVQPTPVP